MIRRLPTGAMYNCGTSQAGSVSGPPPWPDRNEGALAASTICANADHEAFPPPLSAPIRRGFAVAPPRVLGDEA